MKNTIKNTLISLLALLALSGCGPKEDSSKPFTGEPVDINWSKVAKMTSPLDITNYIRSENRVCGGTVYPVASHLDMDSDLVKVAEYMVIDMNVNDYMAHVGSGNPETDYLSPGAGSIFSKRIDYFTGENRRAKGENLARYQESYVRLFKQWMGSPGHCRNLVRSHYNKMGFYAGEDEVGFMSYAHEFSN